MTKSKSKKFSRAAARPFRLTARDLAILRDVQEYRFLHAGHILALHEGSERNVRGRLNLLFQHGYLERPLKQQDVFLSSTHIVYSLGRKSVETLASSQGEREGMLRRIRETERTSPLIAHALMLSQFRVCLTLALKGRDDVRLIRWSQGDDLRRALFRDGEPRELVPDALFVLKTSEFEHPFFLEADRASETRERFVSKLRTYWGWHKDKVMNRTLDFPFFRVLTIATGEGRCENLRVAAKEADPKRTGSGLFLFAPETCYSLTNPQPLLEPPNILGLRCAKPA